MTEPTLRNQIHVNAARIHAANLASRQLGILSIWTVYDHPKDFPDCFVARRFNGKTSQPTDDIITGSLDIIRQSMELCALHRMPREPVDDPKIVEVWL